MEMKNLPNGLEKIIFLTGYSPIKFQTPRSSSISGG